jgi:hypothetical protein
VTGRLTSALLPGVTAVSAQIPARWLLRWQGTRLQSLALIHHCHHLSRSLLRPRRQRPSRDLLLPGCTSQARLCRWYRAFAGGETVVLKTCPLTFLLLGSMSDKTDSLSPMKIWITALCVLLKCTPSAFVARWKKMGGDDEKES